MKVDDRTREFGPKINGEKIFTGTCETKNMENLYLNLANDFSPNCHQILLFPVSVLDKTPSR
jgi:hypothetical protein